MKRKLTLSVWIAGSLTVNGVLLLPTAVASIILNVIYIIYFAFLWWVITHTFVVLKALQTHWILFKDTAFYLSHIGTQEKWFSQRRKTVHPCPCRTPRRHHNMMLFASLSTRKHHRVIKLTHVVFWGHSDSLDHVQHEQHSILILHFRWHISVLYSLV